MKIIAVGALMVAVAMLWTSRAQWETPTSAPD